MSFKHLNFGAVARFVTIGILLTLTAVDGGAKAHSHGAANSASGDGETQGGVFTLTVDIEALRNSTGNIDMLVFDQAQGWPDELPFSMRKFEVPAVEGNMTMKVPNLPPGDYAVIVVHDENLNRRIDKDWRGVPIEQWGMSNNPRVYMSTPAFHRAKFHMQGDMEVHVPMKLYP